MGNQKSMNRSNDKLKVFDGQQGSFRDWKARFVDHMAKVQPTWRTTRAWLGSTRENLSMQRLSYECVGPHAEPADDLARKLESCIVDYLPIDLYRRREQLCGGDRESGNGFAMWRRLHVDCEGDGDSAIEYAGIEVLRNYPRCNQLSEVSTHLDGWTEL